MIKKIKFALVAMLLMMASAAHALNVEKFWKIVSPDKKTEVTVGTVNNIWLYWCIGHNGISVLERSGMNVMVDGVGGTGFEKSGCHGGWCL